MITGWTTLPGLIARAGNTLHQGAAKKSGGKPPHSRRARYSFGFPFLLPPWPVGLSGFGPAFGAAVFAGGP
jgi:hypothetical protein